MATSAQPQAFNNRNSSPSGPEHFRRKEGQVHTKKLRRKIKLRFGHIFLSFIFLAGFFLLLQQVFLFAISWDKLDIKNISITCENQNLEQEVQTTIENYSFGNILLFDSQNLQDIIESFTRVKQVTIRKIFPLSLNISIEERRPFAVLMEEALVVIDKEGVIVSQNETHLNALPLLLDENHFKDYYSEKIDLARICLERLTLQEKQNIEILDLSAASNIRVKMRDSATWLVLGRTRFEDNFRRFLAEKSYLERYGDLEYVDLRFQDRIFIKPLKDRFINEEISTAKEVN